VQLKNLITPLGSSGDSVVGTTVSRSTDGKSAVVKPSMLSLWQLRAIRLLAGVYASPVTASRGWYRQLGPSELVEIFAGHGQRLIFVFSHSELVQAVM